MNDQATFMIFLATICYVAGSFMVQF